MRKGGGVDCLSVRRSKLLVGDGFLGPRKYVVYSIKERLIDDPKGSMQRYYSKAAKGFYSKQRNSGKWQYSTLTLYFTFTF